MSDHSTLPQRLSKVNGDQLVALLVRPSLEEDALLRAYFGPEAYRRLRSLALRCQIMRHEIGSLPDEKPRSYVIIVPGMLGSELSSVNDADQEEVVWLSGRTIAAGALMRLRLAEDGCRPAEPGYKIEVTGLVTRIYAELMLSLAQRYEVHTFPYDWRRSFRAAADDLQVYLNRDFSPDDTVHLVAHAEGGLVTRLHQAKYPEYWKTHQGKLLMLGTPSLGAISGVQALAGHLAVTWWTDILDRQNSKTDLLAVVRSFPSVYELLPSPTHFPHWEALYRSKTYGPEVNSSLLARSKETRQILDQNMECFSGRTICMVGVGRPTLETVNVEALRRESSKPKSERVLSNEIDKIYGPVAFNGDSRVPVLLADARGFGITTYFTDVGDGGLLTCERVLQALPKLLDPSATEVTEVTEPLGLWPSPERALPASKQPGQHTFTGKQMTERWKGLREEMDRSLRHIGSIEERELEDVLLENLGPGSIMGQRTTVNVEDFPTPHIAIEVRYGDISALGAWASDAPPVDAIVFANQLGEEPHGALKAIDKAISQALGLKEALVAQLIQRNVIRSELAALFLLPDPRPGAEACRRTIVIAGQGLPGRFGLPELKILAREVTWVLSRMGKKHIATVALGQGRSGLGTRLIMDAWIRGVKNAVTGFNDGSEPALTLTFVEIDELKTLELDQAVEAVRRELEPRVYIDHTPLQDEELAELQQKAEEKSAAELSKKRDAWQDILQAFKVQAQSQVSTRKEQDAPPIRINISFRGSTYRIGALTATAALPERDITINPKTVLAVNDDLAASRKWQDQIEHGRLLAGLLLPEDLRGYLASDAPVVLTLDATTARIHWELLCPPLSGEDEGFRWSNTEKEPDFEQIRFLGMGRGLTRQLRTSYAPKPETLPTKRRLLRALVIADPAADAPLPGAQEEGVAVADLFERVNLLDNPDNRVEVVRLIGPGEATPTAVLRELMNRSYDLLHFAGHCIYDVQDPLSSGWIFSDGQRMTANEIRRIDRVPSFVFSNACESGVTPDRSGLRSDLLAPTFAESFFARGVANFVCTAWPVNDRSARHFALTLYAGLLGLSYESPSKPAANPPTDPSVVTGPQPMHVAMREARRIIIKHDNRTWGAYQHYGNPNARLFAKPDPETD